MTIVLIVVVALLGVALLGLGTAAVRTRGRPGLGAERPASPVSAPPGGRAPSAPARAPQPGRAPPAPPPAPEPPGPEVEAAPETGTTAPVEAPPPAPEPEVEEAPARSFAERIGRAREALRSSFGQIRSRGRVDAAMLDELEEVLLLADVGLPTTTRLLEPLRSIDASRDGAALVEELKASVLALFSGDDAHLDRGEQKPSVWLVVGVNGVGKTTTIGKLASAEQRAGGRVVIAAGDTFRAAAGEQLGIWAERSGAEIVRGAEGADPSSVIFDAIAHAAAVGADLVIADTAGRLHTRTNLMEELKKVRRVADRPPGGVREVLLVIDATTGQNGLVQAREFTEAVGVTGVVLTKLDGSAKGGIVLAIRSELGLPIKLVGLGEGVEDLEPFQPDDFVEALFS